MSWFLSIVVGVLTAAAGGAGALFAAQLATGWFNVSEREGGRGCAVVVLGGLGLLAGLGLGILVSRTVAAGFLPALGASLGVTAGILLAVTGLCWLRTEHRPRIDGDPLSLEVELRGRAGEAGLPPDGAGGASLILYARNRRHSEAGAFRTDAARTEDGRWVLPGAVPIRSGRSGRLLRAILSGRDELFLIPLRGRPRAADLAWTNWLPRPRADGGMAVNAMEYRYRVARRQS